MPYECLQQLWRKHDPERLGWLRQEAVEWRRDPVIMRIRRPTRPDKGSLLGYKAKQGIIMVRVRVRTGGARKPRPASGRRQKALGSVKFTRAISFQRVGENGPLRKATNMIVMIAYYLISIGNHSRSE